MSIALDNAILESFDEMETVESVMDESSLIDIVDDNLDQYDDDDTELIDHVMSND